jgi:hypothetical protein
MEEMKREHQRLTEIVREKERRKKEFLAELAAELEEHWAIWRPQWERIETMKKWLDPEADKSSYDREIDRRIKKCETEWGPKSRAVYAKYPDV